MFKTVYAFEPDSFNFWCLVNNTQCENVIKIQAALGNSRNLVNLEGTRHISKFISNDYTNSFIPMMRIDDLNLNACSMIQLDVENFEYDCLLGAIKTIKKYKPIIILENGNTPEILSFMKKIKYIIDVVTHFDTIWIHN